MLEGFRASRPKINPEKIVEKYPSHFSIEEIVDSELPKARTELKDELRETLEKYFAKEHEIKEEEALKREWQMVKDWEEFEREKRRENKENLKEEKLKILEELKEMMDESFIIEQRNSNYYEHYLRKDDWDWWVAFSAEVLAKTYFNKINKKASYKELSNLREEIKQEYKAKVKAEEYNANPPRNFYESQKEQDED